MIRNNEFCGATRFSVVMGAVIRIGQTQFDAIGEAMSSVSSKSGLLMRNDQYGQFADAEIYEFNPRSDESRARRILCERHPLRWSIWNGVRLKMRALTEVERCKRFRGVFHTLGVTLCIPLLCVALLFSGESPSIYAQTTLGSVTGSVIDSTGAAIPDSTITVKNMGNGEMHSASTSAEGSYNIVALLPGSYELTASKSGFKSTIHIVSLGAGQTLSLEFKLSVGNASQQITVTGEGQEAVVEKDSHEQSQLLDSAALNNLPVQGRNYLSLAAVGPGAQTPNDNQEGSSATFFGTVSKSIILSGQPIAHTTFLQDGVENVSLLANSANLLSPPEAVQEITVESIGSNARFDRPSVVNVVTKSGTDFLHGQVYDYFQNDAINARNYFATATPQLRYNNFGANVGGPILKKKLFAFFDYNGQRQSSSTVYRTRVPTALERQGNLSEEGIPIYEPGTTTQYPNNTIPNISAFASKYLGFFPNPTGPIVNGINYQQNLPTTNNIDQYLGRLDYLVSSRDTLSGTIQTGNSPVVSVNPAAVFNAVSADSGWNAYIEEIHGFGPNLVNVARVGYNRSVLFATIQGAGTQNWTQEFGLTNLSPSSLQQAPPSVSISNIGSLGNPFAPDGSTQNRYEYADEVNWTRGKHHMFFGAELDYIQFLGSWVIWNDGQYSFNGQYTNSGYGDFLLGLPYLGSGGTGNTLGHFREYDVAGYFQDDWKISPKLTANLGLRYEYYEPVTDKDPGQSVYNIQTNVNTPGSWKPNYLTFAPRIGFAYALDNDTSIRGGFGIYYAPFNYNLVQWTIAKPPNFSLQVQSEGPGVQVPIEQYFSGPPTGSGLAPFTVSPRMPNPYTEQWNLDFQHTFKSQYLMSIAYVGNRGLHQPIRFTPNQAVPEDPANPTPVSSRRPYPYVGEVNAVYNVAGSNYNALQTYLQRRFSNGLQFQVNYTWSHTLDLTDADYASPRNGLDLNSNYGTAGFDRQNVFTATAVYALPFGAGRSIGNQLGWVSKQVIGGWQVSGIFTAETGLPFSVDSPDTANIGGTREAFAEQVCKGEPPAGAKTRNNWFNTSCFVTPPNGIIGNAGRNNLRYPGSNLLQISGFKSFPVSKERSLQFRIDAFNALNRPYFYGDYSQNVASSTYGTLPYAGGNRSVQLALHFVF
jgi:outer membrane receptor protein involved in Fe transport